MGTEYLLICRIYHDLVNFLNPRRNEEDECLWIIWSYKWDNGQLKKMPFQSLSHNTKQSCKTRLHHFSLLHMFYRYQNELTHTYKKKKTFLKWCRRFISKMEAVCSAAGGKRWGHLRSKVSFKIYFFIPQISSSTL